jgi:hypothetical protein
MEKPQERMENVLCMEMFKKSWIFRRKEIIVVCNLWWASSWNGIGNINKKGLPQGKCLIIKSRQDFYFDSHINEKAPILDVYF